MFVLSIFLQWLYALDYDYVLKRSFKEKNEWSPGGVDTWGLGEMVGGGGRSCLQATCDPKSICKIHLVVFLVNKALQSQYLNCSRIDF